MLCLLSARVFAKILPGESGSIEIQPRDSNDRRARVSLEYISDARQNQRKYQRKEDEEKVFRRISRLGIKQLEGVHFIPRIFRAF